LGKRSAWRPARGELSTGTALSSAGNAYRDRFRQGAILYPNTLFVVASEESVVRGVGAVRIRTDPEAAKTAQQLKDERVNEVVESDSLFSTAAAHHLLPYALSSRLWMVVLPALMDTGDQKFGPVDADQLRKAGRVGTARWLDWAEQLWAKARKEGDKTPLHRRIDHLSQLTAQAEMRRYVVLYTAQGNRPVACRLDTEGLALPFVARDQTYWASFDDPDAADVLVALFNSEFVMNAIRDWMTRGLFGPRHIHKRVLDVPWPVFDPTDDRLVEVASLSQRLANQATAITAEGLPRMPGGRQRTWLRQQLDGSNLRRVEELVSSISKGSV
jgi:hypothetical protein